MRTAPDPRPWQLYRAEMERRAAEERAARPAASYLDHVKSRPKSAADVARGSSAEVHGWRAEKIQLETLKRRAADARFKNGRRVVAHDAMMSRTHLLRPLLPFGHLDDEGNASIAACEPGERVPADRILSAPHRAPDPACQCGWRYVTAAEELLPYMAAQARAVHVRLGVKEVAAADAALVSVAGYGRLLPPTHHDGLDEPSSTYRAERYRLTGIVLLPANAVGRAAKPFLRRFAGLHVQYVPSLHRASRADLQAVLDAMGVDR